MDIDNPNEEDLYEMHRLSEGEKGENGDDGHMSEEAAGEGSEKGDEEDEEEEEIDAEFEEEFGEFLEVVKDIQKHCARAIRYRLLLPSFFLMFFLLARLTSSYSSFLVLCFLRLLLPFLFFFVPLSLPSFLMLVLAGSWMILSCGYFSSLSRMSPPITFPLRKILSSSLMRTVLILTSLEVEVR